MIAADVTPALQSKVDELTFVLEEIAALRAIRAAALDTLQEGLDGAEAARARLSQAVQDRAPLPMRYAEDPVQTALLIASTETLDAFAGSLAADPRPPEVTAPTHGTLPLPAQGIIIRNAGEADAAGTVRPGIILATRPRAMVTAPATATVRYAGDLLDREQVVVLEPAADLLVVLAGLDETFVAAGEIVPAGAALGLMGGTTPAADRVLTDRDLQLDQSLYIEVRTADAAVDPLTWFAAP